MERGMDGYSCDRAEVVRCASGALGRMTREGRRIHILGVLGGQRVLNSDGRGNWNYGDLAAVATEMVRNDEEKTGEGGGKGERRRVGWRWAARGEVRGRIKT